jgi:PadR family transcriptional regulator PadR
MINSTHLLDNKFKPIRTGLLEFVLLKIISRSKKSDSQAFYAKEMLEQLSITEFKTNAGTLYPLLSKMKQEKLIACYLEESDSGGPRKHYYLTETGATQLREMTTFWHKINSEILELTVNEHSNEHSRERPH